MNTAFSVFFFAPNDLYRLVPRLSIMGMFTVTIPELKTLFKDKHG